MTSKSKKKGLRKKKSGRHGSRRGQAQKLGSKSVKDSGKEGPVPLFLKSPNIGRPKKTGVRLPHSFDTLEKHILEKIPMPEGYVFVPKGNMYITRHCRADTKASKQTVYVVYNKKGKIILGMRVPEEIYRTVSALDELTAAKRARANEARDSKVIDRGRELLHAEFPLMPDESVELTLKHAFLRGSKRIGRFKAITDHDKAVLAVQAHIRHVHTPYEALLKSGIGRTCARNRVRKTMKTIMRTWEGKSSTTADVPLRPFVIDISSD